MGYEPLGGGAKPYETCWSEDGAVGIFVFAWARLPGCDGESIVVSGVILVAGGCEIPLRAWLAVCAVALKTDEPVLACSLAEPCA